MGRFIHTQGIASMLGFLSVGVPTLRHFVDAALCFHTAPSYGILHRMELLPDLPIIQCPRAPARLGSGDLLANAMWPDTDTVGPFHLLRTADDQPLKAPRFATRLRCQWDDSFFYARFDCDSPDVWATKTVRDDQIWDDPVVEVFLDPGSSGRCFFEFQVNPLGTIYDSYVADARQSENWQHWCAWNSQNLRVAVHIDGKLNVRSHRDRGWSAALAIPWADLNAQGHAPPRHRDVWRANFCRYERARELAEPELSCWAPTVKVFDDLPRFGTIRFLG